MTDQKKLEDSIESMSNQISILVEAQNRHDKWENRRLGHIEGKVNDMHTTIHGEASNSTDFGLAGQVHDLKATVGLLIWPVRVTALALMGFVAKSAWDSFIGI